MMLGLFCVGIVLMIGGAISAKFADMPECDDPSFGTVGCAMALAGFAIAGLCAWAMFP